MVFVTNREVVMTNAERERERAWCVETILMLVARAEVWPKSTIIAAADDVRDIAASTREPETVAALLQIADALQTCAQTCAETF